MIRANPVSMRSSRSPPQTPDDIRSFGPILRTREAQSGSASFRIGLRSEIGGSWRTVDRDGCRTGGRCGATGCRTGRRCRSRSRRRRSAIDGGLGAWSATDHDRARTEKHPGARPEEHAPVPLHDGLGGHSRKGLVAERAAGLVRLHVAFALRAGKECHSERVPLAVPLRKTEGARHCTPQTFPCPFERDSIEE